MAREWAEWSRSEEVVNMLIGGSLDSYIFRCYARVTPRVTSHMHVSCLDTVLTLCLAAALTICVASVCALTLNIVKIG